MFAAPAEIEAEVFTRMPDSFRRRGQSAPWLEFHLRGAERDSLLEGPAFDRQGNLYVVDIPYGRVFRISPAGEWTLIAEYEGEPNGLEIHRDGRIFVADNARGLMELMPETGRVRCVLDGYRHEKFKGLNDLTFAADGTLFFTDQGQTGLDDPTGRLYRLLPDGQLERLLDNIPSPNGLSVSADGSTVFVAATRGNAVWRVPLLRNGWPHKVGIHIQLSGGVGPDGMAPLANGGVAVAHVGLGCVWFFDAAGEPILRVRSPLGRSTTNLAFGGAGNGELFITEAESATVLRASVPFPGAALFSHQ
jgi:gluconolactonase